MITLRSSRLATLQGEFRPPSDKSLTHRAALFAGVAGSPSRISNPLLGEDCRATLAALQKLGVEVSSEAGVLVVEPHEWRSPKVALDCGNSGTTARLISGLLASRDLEATLIGDESLSRRPMGRVANPLRQMGAQIEGETLPLTIRGGGLSSIAYASPVASAQVKSAILLAGLRAQGETSVTEPSLSRDHTERMLRSLGVDLISDEVDGRPRARVSASEFGGFEFDVPGDISSAAFLMVLAALLPRSQLIVRDLGVNPSRTGALDVLRSAGVPIEVSNLSDRLGEPVADVQIQAPGSLSAFEIGGALVPRLIDEIPVLAVMATQCEGTTLIRDAKEMRVKETDRIAVMTEGLKRMGAQIEAHEDGMTIKGPTPLQATEVDATGDHRIAMSFFVAGAIAEGDTIINGAESIATSFPNFQSEVLRLAVV